MYPTLWCPARAICEILKHKSSQKRYRVLSSPYAWKARCTVGRAPEPSLPASQQRTSWPPPQSPTVASSASGPTPDTEATAAVASRKSTRPTDPERAHRTRNNVGFFGYAVTKAVWKSPSLLPVAPFTQPSCGYVSIQFYLWRSNLW